MDPFSTPYNVASLQGDWPDDIPAWDFAQECFGTLEEYMHIGSIQLPVAGSIDVAEAAGVARHTPEEGPSSSSPADNPSSSSPAEGNPRLPRTLKSPGRRRQAQNRSAQQRLRQRQKVSRVSPALHLGTAQIHEKLEMQNQSSPFSCDLVQCISGSSRGNGSTVPGYVNKDQRAARKSKAARG